MSTIFETPRLILREFTLEDVDSALRIVSDPETMRYYPGTKSRVETVEWIERHLNMYQSHGHGLWATELKETGEFLGGVGLIAQEVEGTPETEIGYLLIRKHWSQGYATEAACGCRDYGFATLRRPRLVSLIDPRNWPSRRVADRVGLQLEREVIKWDKPVCVYAIENPTESQV